MIKKGFYKKACKVAQNETISLKYVISTEEEKKKEKRQEAWIHTQLCWTTSWQIQVLVLPYFIQKTTPTNLFYIGS